jgi:hypothetical protein
MELPNDGCKPDMIIPTSSVYHARRDNCGGLTVWTGPRWHAVGMDAGCIACYV